MCAPGTMLRYLVAALKFSISFVGNLDSWMDMTTILSWDCLYIFAVEQRFSTTVKQDLVLAEREEVRVSQNAEAASFVLLRQ